MKKNELHGNFQHTLQVVMHMRIILFMLVLILLYGFIGWRIHSLANAKPGLAAVEAETKATSKPSIDPALVDKIKQLEDNSVNVKSLFDEARQNPFQE
jgi:hypothetical protein